MKKEVILNTNMHLEHEQWKDELEFWKGELVFFNEKTNNFEKQRFKKKLLTKIKHFKKEFNLLKIEIDKMLLEIEEHENKIAPRSELNINKLDMKLMKNHGEFRGLLKQHRHNYSNLKRGFFRLTSEQP